LLPMSRDRPKQKLPRGGTPSVISEVYLHKGAGVDGSLVMLLWMSRDHPKQKLPRGGTPSVISEVYLHKGAGVER
jgi:hypothetical protein